VDLNELLDADLCISYGAEGTMLRFLLAGVPQLISPWHVEAFMAGRKVAAAGLGLTIEGAPTVETVSKLISHLTGDATIRARAMAFRSRAVSGPPVIPVSPFLAPYRAGTFQSYVNTLDTPQVCRYSRANNPSVQRNIVTGGTVGFLTFGTVGAVVGLNIVGFPEVELAEGGAAALGGGAWLFEAAVAEPAGSMAIGGLGGHRGSLSGSSRLKREARIRRI
jgi:hypothetical protein